MSGTMQGADIDALNNLRLTLERSAVQLHRITGAASSATATLDRLWDGPDSAQFQLQWQRVHRRQLSQAGSELQAAGATIERNRQSQEVTSATLLGTAAIPGVSVFTSEPGDHGGPLGPPAPKPTTDQILEDYQAVEDELITWRPNLGGLPFGLPFGWGPSQELTRTEGELLDDLGSRRGYLGLREFQNTQEDALETARERYPESPDNWGDHADAYRHIYWNALMTQRFGHEFAEDFATAHEGVAGKPAQDEAMDLYNNSIGRQIALDNPDASAEELADLVYEAVENGDAVVLDSSGELTFSDQVTIDETGNPDGPSADGDGKLTPGDGPGRY